MSVCLIPHVIPHSQDKRVSIAMPQPIVLLHIKYNYPLKLINKDGRPNYFKNFNLITCSSQVPKLCPDSRHGKNNGELTTTLTQSPLDLSTFRFTIVDQFSLNRKR